MAVRTGVYERIKTFGNQGHVVTWSGLTQASLDTGDPCEMIGSSDRSVHVRGTFGAGGNLVIEGSNDGVNYTPLADPQGTALNFTAEKIESVLELVRYIRPRVTAGDGTTSLVVVMLLRNPRRG